MNTPFWLLFISAFCINVTANRTESYSAIAGEERRFRVSEAAEIGEHIGWINEYGPLKTKRQNYFIVFPDFPSESEKLLEIDEQSGEIRVKSPFDYESERELHGFAIPVDMSTGGRAASGVRIIVELVDENDNAPEFPSEKIYLEISEASRPNTEFALPVARDADSGPYSTQSYRIIEGNVNDDFLLTAHHFDSFLYADLIVNKKLDREKRDRYELLIEALDGGNPPRTGRLQVIVMIIDVNDNAPQFARKRYTTHLTSDAPIGFPVIKVVAYDADTGANKQISYKFITSSIHKNLPFSIDENNGLIIVANELSYSNNSITYDLLVNAYDHGQPISMEATVNVAVTIVSNDLYEEYDFETVDGIIPGGLNFAEQPPYLDIVWLTDYGNPQVTENSQIGLVLARIFVMHALNHNLTLTMHDVLCLNKSENPSVYLLLICGDVDREKHEAYMLKFLLRDAISGDVAFDHAVHIKVCDINDNAPLWNVTIYRIEWRIGVKNNVRFTATDADINENARIRYSLRDTTDFNIDSETGQISTTKKLECLDSSLIPKSISFRIIAEDSGEPSLFSAVNVHVHFIDDSQFAQIPIFAQSFYEATILENVEIFTCILQLFATVPNCPNNLVRYKILNAPHDKFIGNVFKISPTTGRLCVKSTLDFERHKQHEFLVEAEGHNGLTSTTLVRINVENVNDNVAKFYTTHHYLALKMTSRNILESYFNYSWSHVLNIEAFDEDEIGLNHVIRYELQTDIGNGIEGLLRVDSQTGALHAREPFPANFSALKRFNVKIVAKDQDGFISPFPAIIHIYLIDNEEICSSPIEFTQRIYEFTINEEFLPGVEVGRIAGIGSNNAQSDYSLHILSSDEVNEAEIPPFHLDSRTWGKIVLSGELDAEKSDVYIFSIEAKHKRKNVCRNITQIFIRVNDANDNAPKFAIENMTIHLAENFAIHKPFLALSTMDVDKIENGRVTYELVECDPPAPIVVDPLHGNFHLTAPLDFEKVTKYRMRIRARDSGVPSRYTNIFITLKVVDMNDNSPKIEKAVYDVEIVENAPILYEFLTVNATDEDRGANGDIVYSILENSARNFFGIYKESGILFVRALLDREKQELFTFTVCASDRGKPSHSSNTTIRLRVLDINDNAPDCANIESQPLIIANERDEIAGWLRATDADKNANGNLTYRLQMPNEIFDVKSNGAVYIRKIPRKSYVLPIVIEDGGNDPQFTTCLLTIRVVTPNQLGNLSALSKNDYLNSTKNIINMEMENFAPDVVVPQLHNSVVTTRTTPITYKTIRESTNFSAQPVLKLSTELEAGIKLLTVNGGDNNEMNNPKFYYKFADLSANLENLFDLDELIGEIRLRDVWALQQRLRQRTLDEFEVHVLKYSTETSHTIPNRSTFVFDLSESDSSIARFSRLIYRWNVSEMASIGFIIGQVEIIRGNVSQFHFKLIEEFDQKPSFHIDSKTGEIYLQQQLQFEELNRHVIVVEATEISNLNAQPHLCSKSIIRRSIIVINVIDENNKTPYFLSRANVTLFNNWLPLYSTSIPIHYFVARDDDTGEYGHINYIILDENKNELFEVNAETGALYIKDWNLLMSQKFPVEIQIRASDCGGSPVCIGDTSRARYTEQNFKLFADESLFAPNGAQKFAYFPRSLFEFTMTMGAPANTVVYNFKQIDNYLSPSLRFYVFSNFDRIFEIDAKTGILKTLQILKSPKYYAIVIVRDIAHEPARVDYTQLLVHTINASALHPRIAQASCAPIVVRENVAIAKLAKIFAYIEGVPLLNSQSDFGLVFNIEGGSGSELFLINETSGVVSCRELDRETKTEHILVISASDHSTPKKVDICTLRVTVLDENDNVPEFHATLPEAIEINDATTLNATLLRVDAHDADTGANARLRYRLVSDPTRMFDLDPDTGVLIFAREFPIANAESFIIFTVEDCGESRILSTERQLRVIWRRAPVAPLTIADAALKRGTPRFLRQKYSAVIFEAQSKGQSIAQIETDWPKSRGPLAYSIVSGNLNGAFSIDDSGRVFTTRPLDAESRAHYNLKIIAGPNSTGGIKLNDDSTSSNFHSLSALESKLKQKSNGHAWTNLPETYLEIHILDINDNAPIISPLNDIVFPEDLQLGSSIVQLRAIDMDREQTALEYTLNPVSEHFEIGRYTGIIYLIKLLDYEEFTELCVGVQVYDGEHVTRANFTVKILDVNDNTPNFVENASFVELSISSDSTSPGIVLHRFHAVDYDSDVNGAIRYTLLDRGIFEENENRLSYFIIDEKTGDLKVSKKLPRNGEYFVQIRAEDGGMPSHSSTITVRILIEDSHHLDENLINFSSAIFRFSIDEDFPQFLPFANANDFLEKNSNSKNSQKHHYVKPCGFIILFYSESNKTINASRHFAINPFTGELFATTTLGYAIKNDGESLRFDVAIPRKCQTTLSSIESIGKSTNKSALLARTTIIINVIDAKKPWKMGNYHNMGIEFSSQNVIKEDLKRGSILGRIILSSVRASKKSQIRYKILSGNCFNVINLDPKLGEITMNHWDNAIIDHVLRDANEKYENINELTEIPYQLAIGVYYRNINDTKKDVILEVIQVELMIDLVNWANGAPKFATSPLRRFVSESVVVGERLFSARAISRLPYPYRHGWSYSIEMDDAEQSLMNSKSILDINSTSGEVYLAKKLDFEQLVHDKFFPSQWLTTYAVPLAFRVRVDDCARSKFASVPLILYVMGDDEFGPVFSKLSYTFQIPFNVEVGDHLGIVNAMDRDAGFDGRVRYTLRADGHAIPSKQSAAAVMRKFQPLKYFRINADTGQIFLRRPLPLQYINSKQKFDHDKKSEHVENSSPFIVRLTVEASSGIGLQELSTKAIVYLEIEKERTINSLYDQILRLFPTLNAAALGVLCAFVALFFCLIVVVMRCRRRAKNSSPLLNKKLKMSFGKSNTIKSRQKQVYSVSLSAKLTPDELIGIGTKNRSLIEHVPILKSLLEPQLRLPPPPPVLNQSTQDMSYVARHPLYSNSISESYKDDGTIFIPAPLSQPDSGIIIEDADNSESLVNNSMASELRTLRVFPQHYRDLSQSSKLHTAQIISTHNFRPYRH